MFIDTNLTATSLSGLGAVDNLAIENTIGQDRGTRGKYRKYTNEDKFKIGKFAIKNGAAACVRRFKTDFSKLNDSTVQYFKRKYEQELKNSKRNGKIIDRTLIVEKRHQGWF